ncbi:prolipoprotein diacylglyceryl transferase [Aeromicrobium alkaliterrae]|uniref:Phosphatidylglycerol--prolipoprotein diacylglyceryl transferase n=1 Tax=Aeromicrobium alkaliterrae TaxID=302168 RepID=A0ABN2JN17_9ACTN
MNQLATYIPSPETGVWEIGPLPLRAYALGIIIGALLAIWIGERRFQARGGHEGVIADVAIWAIPFGIVGARLYHVATDPELYFAEGRRPIEALYIWQGGLGIWGAIAGGAIGAFIATRRAGVSFSSVADAIAPGLLVAQAVGRIGNYFNQELFGKPTTLPWGLEIDPGNRPLGYIQYATFHPTFLYELLWNLAAAAVLIWLDKKYRFTGGRAFWLYVMLYTAGRFWIEQLRIDDVNEIGFWRLNVWTSLIVFAIGAFFFFRTRGRAPEASEAAADDAQPTDDEDVDRAATSNATDETAAEAPQRPDPS